MIWWQPLYPATVPMLSAIIATHESERALVPTLSALVPAVTTGLLREVIVADAGSRDATAEVAEIAGCRFMSSTEPLGARLSAAVNATRTPWLLFLHAGTVPAPGWTTSAEHFMQSANLANRPRAAVFRKTTDALQPSLKEVFGLLRAALGGAPSPRQGLLISRRAYDAVGGHNPAEDADMALLRRLGRRRITMLASGATIT
jgi:glycosyltransferase involved in cell wall biosynthesis